MSIKNDESLYAEPEKLLRLCHVLLVLAVSCLLSKLGALKPRLTAPSGGTMPSGKCFDKFPALASAAGNRMWWQLPLLQLPVKVKASSCCRQLM